MCQKHMAALVLKLSGRVLPSMLKAVVQRSLSTHTHIHYTYNNTLVYMHTTCIYIYICIHLHTKVNDERRQSLSAQPPIVKTLRRAEHESFCYPGAQGLGVREIPSQVPRELESGRGFSSPASISRH